MPPGVKSLLALAGAVGMVFGAVAVRSALDDKEVSDAIKVRLTCDPALADACQAAAAADGRITVTIESPATTQKRLRSLEPGKDPGLDAWVTIGPWLGMVDGARAGQARLGRSSRPIVSTPVVLVGGRAAAGCGKTPIGCAGIQAVGLRAPTDDGVGLAGTVALVSAASGVPITDLDKGTLVRGPAADPLSKLKRQAQPIGLEAVNSSFSTAQVIVTTAASSRVVGTRATVTALPVNAVVEVALLRDDAAVPLAAGAGGATALHDRLVADGWEATPQPSNLPDADVLAALQAAWASA